MASNEISLQLPEYTQSYLSAIATARSGEFPGDNPFSPSIKGALEQDITTSEAAIMRLEQALNSLNLLNEEADPEYLGMIKSLPSIADNTVALKYLDVTKRLKRNEAINHLHITTRKLIEDIEEKQLPDEPVTMRPDSIEDSPAIAQNLRDMLLDAKVALKVYEQVAWSNHDQRTADVESFIEPSEFLGAMNTDGDQEIQDKFKKANTCRELLVTLSDVLAVMNLSTMAIVLTFHGLCACVPIISKCLLSNFPYTCSFPITIETIMIVADTALWMGLSTVATICSKSVSEPPNFV